MSTHDTKLYQEELEELTGKIYSGDITPLVYELLKSSPERNKLIKSLGGTIKKKTKPVEPATDFLKFDTLFANGLEVR